ncbi:MULTISPECIES: mannose-6-phosphate isomerase, class I [unclassified Polaribacter]|uniref:mannose-6-phosphate isomerase, class I n=1 Tax=unclassified Polaribacter TaxID=196858 RepID=UPI0011BE6387|nr:MULTISPECIES: mannose-6-phosphate isomerase, class I [unclassified Polaribacter]TXD50577.1 mannose-6-phosphate isomerase, class I [Polaribacter sp. IC063]TXD61734.1 mannose-6-phosphate isomerase, class I [Polaribacter sp. IC066]
MTKLYLLKGKIQNYAWGGSDFIPNLLGEKATEEKCAEYWLGAHDNAPSEVLIDQETKPLNNFLNTDLKEKLGQKIASKFGRLSFLFKVLDVKDVLSIQVHPTKIAAEKGFKVENEMGIPLKAAHRNYKDDNHKPEIMVALGEFWLLHGFLPEDKLVATLKNIKEFTHLLPVFKEQGYYGLYKTVMEQSDEDNNRILQPLIDKILPAYKAGNLEKSNPAYWAAKAVDSSTNTKILDKGIYSIYFFNVVKANKGEAVFQDAGIPHAYLEGQNMELMANSDNVLRGGLTPKHVDIPELLKHVEFKATVPNVMQGELQKDGLERIYKSAAPDFELSQITLNANQNYKSETKTAQILILLEGEATIKEQNTRLHLKKGAAVLILANAFYEISTSKNAILYKATAPD